MTVQLCPCCGSADIKVEYDNSLSNYGYICALYCDECKVKAPAGCGLNGAIKNWNELRYERKVDDSADTDTDQQKDS